MHDSHLPSPAAGDEPLSVLARDDCRAVVRYFRRRSSDVATVEDLSAFVRQRREGEGGTRIEISLHHSTLPRLDDAGFLDYDARSDTAPLPGRRDERNEAGSRDGRTATGGE